MHGNESGRLRREKRSEYSSYLGSFCWSAHATSLLGERLGELDGRSVHLCVECTDVTFCLAV